MKSSTLFSQFLLNQLHQIVLIVLVVITLFISFPSEVKAINNPSPIVKTIQSNDYNIPSNAPITQQHDPQAYKVGKKAVKAVSKNINNTLENVKDKLNLDESLPESTKEFLANPLAIPKVQNIPKQPVGNNV